MRSYDQLLTQSQLIALLHSLIARRWNGLYDGPDLKLFILVGWDRGIVCC